MSMGIIKFKVVDGVEIAVLAGIIYYFLSFIKGTKALQMMIGIVSLLVLMLIADFLKFETLSFIFKGFGAAWLIILVFLFQPELRTALARIGARFGKPFTHGINLPTDELVRAIFALSEKKDGGIIVVERDISLKNYADTGQAIEARLSSELILSIFNALSPLHDGAIIVKNNMILAAACILPISDKILRPEIGTRHRAALGLSEEADAVCIIVSEETGNISIAANGELVLNIEKANIKQELIERIA